MPKDLKNFLTEDNGSNEDFNELFTQLYPPLCFYCNSYIKDMDLARSLVQQVFVDLWIKRKKLNINQSVRAYLYNAVRNKTIDHLRKYKKTIPFCGHEEGLKFQQFKDPIQESEEIGRINEAINSLPPKCKEIFMLCKLENLKYKQIAEKLNISTKTVDMQMGIALKRLRSKLSVDKGINLFISFFPK